MKPTILSPILLAMLLLQGCSKPQEQETAAAVPVEVTEVRGEPIERVIRAEGVLRALDQSSVVPKITAPVAQFSVNRGDHVTKGQLLARLESRDLAAAVAEAKGAYEQAAANYRNIQSSTVPNETVKAQADVQAARQQVDAAKKLRDSREELYKEGALARRLVDESEVLYAQARSQYETARKILESLETVGKHEEIKSAQGQLDSAKARYEAAQAQLAYSEVRSPISGVVADRPTFAGEMATTGAPLLTIVDISSVIARVNVPPAEAAHIRVGQRARVRLTDGPAETSGKVTVVSPAVDPQATTIEIWVQAANPGEQLRPGQTVHVEIAAGTIPNAAVVPADALMASSEGGSALMAIGADLIAHERKVEVGVRTGGRVQILSGVAPGERVVSAGGSGLKDGARVKVVQHGAAQESTRR
jgi:HlyD family secretion protein